MQYSVIPSDSHATQAFIQLQQGLDEPLDKYLHCVSELLSKIYCTSDMSRMLVKGLNHYSVVCSLNCKEVKDSITECQSLQWKMIKECLRDICDVRNRHEQAKGYCSAKFNTPDASCITEVKTMKKTGLCYKCRRPHFQCNCRDNSGNSSNKFHIKTPT